MDSHKYMVFVTEFLRVHVLSVANDIYLAYINPQDFKFTYKMNVCFAKVLCNRTI